MATRAYLAWAQLALPYASLAIPAATGTQGTPVPSGGVTLSGQAATAGVTPQSLISGGGTQRAYLSWAQLQIPSPNPADVSQPLTGQPVTASQGTIIGGGARAYLSWARLQLPVANSVRLIGSEGASSAGTIYPVQGIVQPLTGQHADGSVGAPAPGRFAPLNGLFVTASYGTMVAADETFAFLGTMVPLNTEALTVPTMTAGFGVLACLVDGAVQVQLVGQFAPALLNAPAHSSDLMFTGVSATASVGQALRVQNAALTGLEATSASGAFVYDTVQLSGLTANIDGGDFLLNSNWVNVPGSTSIWTPRVNNPANWT